MRQGYGPLLGSVSHVDHQSPEALEAEIERVGAGNVAAFFCEPVIGAGGVRPGASGLHRGGRGDLQAPRRPARDRQRDLRVRPRGHLVRIRALGHRARHGRARQGHHERLPAARRRDDQRRRRRAVLGRGGRGHVPSRGHLRRAIRPVAPPRSPTSTSSSARSLIPRGRELEGELMDVLAPLADHPACGEIRGGLGLAAAVDLTPEALKSVPGAMARYAGAISRGGRAPASAGDGRRDRPATHDRRLASG